MTQSHETAIIAKRAARPPVKTDEIEALVEAGGFSIEAVLTQVRPEDPATHLGSGKVDELVECVRNHDASTVVIDGEVTTGQARNLILALPDGVTLLDRYRLVLEIFAEQATDRRAAAQVELARLEYQLDWYEAVAEESPLTKMNEKGSPRYQLEDRITALRTELASLPDPAERLQARRRESGFDLVTIAGYTNAGKSTLLRRLADEMRLTTAEDEHPDRATTAGVEDRLFKTLETTTRRATLRGRPVLCTDTVGYVRDLPHDLVVSFAETLSAADIADAVVLVTDATQQPERFDETLEVATAVLSAQGVDEERVIPVLNKVDAIDHHTRTERCHSLDRFPRDPVAISATEGRNLDGLTDAILEVLPTTSATIDLPAVDAAMSFVSQAYDRAAVDDVEYAEDTVSIDLTGRPHVVDELRREAAGIAAR